MTTLIASKTEILKESRKIKTRPRSHQIELLTFKKKVHYKKFVDWVDSSDDALKKVKLPKRKELFDLMSLAPVAGLSIVTFWDDIKKRLEKIGFGNWKLGAGIVGGGLLGGAVALKALVDKLNPFKSKVKRGPVNRFKRFKKRSGRLFDKRRRVKINRAKNIKNIKRQRFFQQNQKRISRTIKKIKEINPFKDTFKKKVPKGKIIKIYRGHPSNTVPFSSKSNLSKIKSNLFKKPNLNLSGIQSSSSRALSKLKNIKVSPGGLVKGAKGFGIGLAIDWVADQTLFKGMNWGFDRLGESQMRNAVEEHGWQKVFNKQTQRLQEELAKKDKPWYITEGGIGSGGYKNQGLIEVLQKNIKYLQKLKEEKQSSLSPTINNLIKPSEKTVVVSQKAQSNDGDTTIVMAPKEQQVLPSQPAQQGGVIPFPVGGGNNSAMIASSVPESETLNNMWTNILLTKLSTS